MGRYVTQPWASEGLDFGGKLGLEEALSAPELAHSLVLDGLSGDKPSRLPKSFGALTELRRLELYEQKLSSLPDLSTLSQLRTLILIDTPIRSLPNLAGVPLEEVVVIGAPPFGAILEQLASIPTLKRLTLGGRVDAVECLAACSQLESFTLARDEGTDLDALFSALAHTRVRALALTHVNRLPASIGAMQSLRSLVLGEARPGTRSYLGGGVERLPEELCTLELERLEVLRQPLTELPESLGRMATLQRLMVRYTGIGELPDLAGLVSLEALDVSQNKLRSMRACCVLPRLESLNLWANDIDRIPDDVQRLTRLRVLNLVANPLADASPLEGLPSLTTVQLPPAATLNAASLPTLQSWNRRLPEGSFGALRDLTTRGPLPDGLTEGEFLDRCVLTTAAEHVATDMAVLARRGVRQLELRVSAAVVQLTPMPRLERLQISGTVERLAPLQAAHLERLALSGVGLSVLPELGDIPALRSLDLFGNPMAALPADLARCTALRELVLGDNSFHQLGGDVGRLTDLRTLRLFRSAVTSLPDAIGGLRHLERLSLEHCGSLSVDSVLANIQGMASLRHLQLGVAGMDLPDRLAGLTGLETLGLESSAFVRLPPSIGELLHLHEVRLSPQIGAFDLKVAKATLPGKGWTTVRTRQAVLLRRPRPVGVLRRYGTQS